MKYDKQDYKIKDVSTGRDWYTISTTDSTGFGLKKKWGKFPKPGDTITLYTKGFSHIVGMDLNGERCFLFTEEELEQHRQEELLRMEEEKLSKFAKNQNRMDKDYSNLPNVFKKRIDRFRSNNPRFRIDYEDYELFCCKEAVMIAKKLKTVEEIQRFYKLSWEDQKKLVPRLSEGHSGNTFGASCNLAMHYLTNEENVVRQHGALSPLVGSEEYGDIDKI